MPTSSGGSTKCCAFSLAFINFMLVNIFFFSFSLLAFLMERDNFHIYILGFVQRNRDTTATNGCTLIFVYMTYTMLPVRLREALIGGLLLSVLHIYLGVYSATHISWTEVSELGADGLFFGNEWETSLKSCCSFCRTIFVSIIFDLNGF